MLVLVTLTARAAEAQTTTTTSTATITVSYESSLPRVDVTGKQLQKRNLQLTPEAVSNQDCVDDQRIRFTLLLSGYVANATIEAWAANSGQDCSAATARGTTAQQCWKILDSAISLQPQVNVDIPVRRIMSGVTPFMPATPVATADVCGKVDLANISVQFLYFDPGNLSQAAVNHTIAVTVDTVGPAAPTGLSILPGNTRLQMTWANISGGDPDAGVTGGLTELTGVAAYCSPSAGTASGVATTTDTDAGCTTSDGGIDGTGDASVVTVCTDAGISTTTDADAGATFTCSNDVFGDAGTTTTTTDAGGDSGTTDTDTSTSTTNAIIPNSAFNALYQCGSYTGNSGTTVIADTLRGAPLKNGTQYAVAVAATDKYGNVGPLSSVLCEIPEETTDFWEAYRDAGGLAGGCATVATEPVPLGTLTAGAAFVLVGASVIRRRRNRR